MNVSCTQSVFASDVKVPDLTSSGAWKDFVQLAKKTVELFEGADYSAEELQQAEAAGAATDALSGGGDGSSDSEAYMGCKFLTSSQVWLSAGVYSCVSLSLSASTAIQCALLLLLVLLPLSPRAKLPPALPQDKTAELSRDLLYLHHKAGRIIEVREPTLLPRDVSHSLSFVCLQRTPGHGSELLEVVRRLLSRENHWHAWKLRGSSAFEKFPPTTAAAGADSLKRRPVSDAELEAQTSSGAYKRQRPAAASARPTKGRPQAQAAVPSSGRRGAEYEFDCSDAHAKEMARRLLLAYPVFEEQIQVCIIIRDSAAIHSDNHFCVRKSYVDAEDPDCGIEDEYHPKHDRYTHDTILSRVLCVTLHSFLV